MALLRSRRRSGLTLLEVVIASIILTAVFGMTAYMIWSSSKHTETTEAALQLEASARAFMDALAKDVQQTRLDLVNKVDTTQLIPVDSTSLKLLATPGTAVVPDYYNPTAQAATPGPPATPAYPVKLHTDALGNNVADFDGIRFRLPGSPMDLTPANAKNFDLKSFKTNTDAPNWLYEVQYWWEIDSVSGVNEGKAGAGPKGFVRDGIDNNQNGVVDEGIVYKLETWYKPDGTLDRRTQTVACRDVKSLAFYIPQRKWNGTDWAGDIYTTPPNQIIATVTVERADPLYPKHPDRNIVRTVSTVIDVRNNRQ
jgi:hypothetical protein